MALLIEDALTGTEGNKVKYLKKGVCITTEAGAPTNSMAATELIPGMERTLENGMTPIDKKKGKHMSADKQKQKTIRLPRQLSLPCGG